MNRNYGKLNESGAITYAPNNIRIGETIYAAPTAEQYATQGWLPVIDERPAERDGYYSVPTGWMEADGKIVRAYEERAVEPPPAPVRHFSKLRLYVVMTKLGITDEQFMAWLATKEVEVDGAMIRGDIAYNRAQDLTDNHPMFSRLVADAQTAFGITDAQLAEILVAIEYNPMEV